MHARWVALLSLLFAALCPTGSCAPIRLAGGSRPSALETYALSELRAYLPRLTEEPIASGDGDGARVLVGTTASNSALRTFTPRLPGDLEEQEILVWSGRAGGAPAVAVTGGSPQAVLWATYELLERLGVIFEFSGEILPDRRPRLDLTGLQVRRKPSIPERGLRLHLNFPMDQSSYPLSEFLDWVDRMARMKLNYLMFHFYSTHPWFRFEYRGAKTTSGTYFVGTHLFGGKYLLPEDMIGRRLVRNRAQYFPPELEGMEQGEELYRKTEERMRAVMDRAKHRGMKVAVSFEPLSPPGDIAGHLGEWEQEAGGRDALMRDLTVARLLACMDAYPRADEYQLISVEGSSDAPAELDLKAELRRLCGKYGIPFDPEDEARFAGARDAGVNLTPYNAPEAAAALEKGLYRPVVSTLRYVDLALDVLADARVAQRMRREAKEGAVGIYLPHAAAVALCVPALRAMMPAGSRLQLMVDYGARGTADQMPTWQALKGADLRLGVMSWIEFDGSMFLPQTWPRSVYDCVTSARELPLETLVANHWRVSGLEADAAALAEAPWRDGRGYEEWLEGYLARLYGREQVGAARRAYEALEQATLYCRAHLFNVGFCYEGRFRNGFGYPQEHLDAARGLYADARDRFAELAGAPVAAGAKGRAEYLANRCQCALVHLDTMQTLAAAEAQGSASPEAMTAAAELADKGLELARGYMKTYAQCVRDRGDEGMLVNYHFALVQRAESMARMARQAAIIARIDATAPLMYWSFEDGDAKGVPDASGNGFTAVGVGDVAFAPGKVGRALRLDGKSYLRVDDGAGCNPTSITIAAWVLPERTTARRGIVAKRIGNTASPFVLGISDGLLRFEGCGTSQKFWPFNFSGPALEVGKWSHVAVTLEAGRKIVLYLNGRAVAAKEIDESPAPNPEPIVLGREAWGGEQGQQSPAYFHGLLDEVKLWKRALAPEEVAAEAGR